MRKSEYNKSDHAKRGWLRDGGRRDLNNRKTMRISVENDLIEKLINLSSNTPTENANKDEFDSDISIITNYTL